MSDDQSVTAGWVLEYVNAREFLGRYNGQWTKGGIGTALILPSSEEAEQALDSLLSEADQRIRTDGARRFWFDLYGGLVVVTEVEVVARRKIMPISEEPKAPDVCGWDGPDTHGMSLTLCGNWVRWHPTFKFCPHCGRSLAGTVAILRDLGPQTDENRVSFAAGYSQALDDQAKRLK